MVVDGEWVKNNEHRELTMKTYTFRTYITVGGRKEYKEFVFTAYSWTEARKMLSDSIRAAA